MPAKAKKLGKMTYRGENRGAFAETAQNVQNIPRKAEPRAPMKSLTLIVKLTESQGMHGGQLDANELHEKLADILRTALKTDTLHLRTQIRYYLKTQAGKFR